MSLKDLEKHLLRSLQTKVKKLNEAELLLVGRHLQRLRFYMKLDEFGYKLFLKPVATNKKMGTTKEKQL